MSTNETPQDPSVSEPEPATSRDRNRSVVAAMVDAQWNRHDLTAVADTYADDARVHVPGYDTGGLQDVVDDCEHYFAAFDDVEMHVEDLLADGDRVVLRWCTTGRHIGDYYGNPPTGKIITMRGVDIFRMADGRIVEAWSMWDGLDVYRQLGVLPQGL